MVVSGALFDMRDLAQMLAHVHDAAMEVGEGPETPALGGGAHAVGRLRLIVQAATFPSPRPALLRITDSQLGHRARSEKCHYRK
jgi:hypothetical protein